MDFSTQKERAKCVAVTLSISHWRILTDPGIFNLPVLIFIMFFLTFSLQATTSEHGSATVNDQYEIVLDVEKSLTHIYEADISHFNFSSEEAARAKFDLLGSPACSIIVQWDSKKIEIVINPDPIHEGFTVAQWNEHFKEMAKAINQN